MPKDQEQKIPVKVNQFISTYIDCLPDLDKHRTSREHFES